MDDELRFLPVAVLDETLLPLRPVDQDAVEYLELIDSIRENGIANSILVRPSPKTQGRYEIIDGMYRYSAAKAAGLDNVPCIVKHGVTNDDVLVLQLQTNAIRPTTSPMEYARRLRMLLDKNPEMTVRDLSRLIRKNTKWVSDTLSLTELNKELRPHVERGVICLAKAYELARIPRQWQLEFFGYAKEMSTAKFRSTAREAIKRYREAVQQGRLSELWKAPKETTAYLRPLNAILSEISSRSVGASILAAEKCRTVVDAFYAGLRWSVHQDKLSVDEQVAKIKRAMEASDAVLRPPDED